MSLDAIRKALGSDYAVAGFGDAFLIVPVNTSTKAKSKKAEEEVEESDDEDEDGPDLESMTLAELKKFAKENEYSASDLKGLDKEGIIALLTGDDDEEESEEDDDEDEEESEGYDEESLSEMSLSELKTIAKEEFDATAADLKGKKAEGLIEWILEAQEGSEEGDDEGDDEEDEEEDDEEGLTEDDLKAMSLSDLKAVAKENGIKVKADWKKPQIVKAIIKAASE